MSDLYYTQEEIDQLQKDIIEKYFKDDKETIENIKKHEIIGYEKDNDNKYVGINSTWSDNPTNKILCRYVSFINIYGDIFNGIFDNKIDNSCIWFDKNNENILLKAFSKQISTRSWNTNNASITYTYKPLEVKKGILLPKIILKNIIDNNLIYKLRIKDNKHNTIDNDICEIFTNSNCSEKYKFLIDIIKKEKDQQKEIEELKSKLAEQTKLNNDICERMFELKEQLLKN